MCLPSELSLKSVSLCQPDVYPGPAGIAALEDAFNNCIEALLRLEGGWSKFLQGEWMIIYGQLMSYLYHIYIQYIYIL